MIEPLISLLSAGNECLTIGQIGVASISPFRYGQPFGILMKDKNNRSIVIECIDDPARFGLLGRDGKREVGSYTQYRTNAENPSSLPRRFFGISMYAPSENETSRVSKLVSMEYLFARSK